MWGQVVQSHQGGRGSRRKQVLVQSIKRKMQANVKCVMNFNTFNVYDIQTWIHTSVLLCIDGREIWVCLQLALLYLIQIIAKCPLHSSEYSCWSKWRPHSLDHCTLTKCTLCWIFPLPHSCIQVGTCTGLSKAFKVPTIPTTPQYACTVATYLHLYSALNPATNPPDCDPILPSILSGKFTPSAHKYITAVL